MQTHQLQLDILRTNAYHKDIFICGTFPSIVSAEAQHWIRTEQAWKLKYLHTQSGAHSSLVRGECRHTRRSMHYCKYCNAYRQTWHFCFWSLLPRRVQRKGKCLHGTSFVLPLQEYKMLHYFLMSYCNTVIIPCNPDHGVTAEAIIL